MSMRLGTLTLSNSMPPTLSLSTSALNSYCRATFSSSFIIPNKPLNFSFTNQNQKNNNNHRMTNIACLSSATTPPHDDSPSPPSAAVLQPKPKPWLIVGLGNPGKKFAGTRHNVGFEMVDTIAEAEGISMNSVSFKSLFGKGHIGNVPVILSKPQTFMNLSGESVGPLVSYYKIPLKQVLLIYDDLDLPFGKLRLLPKGGHGGQNGMRSVIDHLKGNRDFPRLRIGIGRPPGKMDPATYVLRPFNKQERQELDFSMQKGVDAVRILLLEGINKSATFVNSAKSLEQLS